MKKTLSVILALIMLTMTMVFAVGAAGAACGCEDHNSNRTEKCHCCIFCDNLDTHYLTSCASKADGTLESPLELCCSKCDGVFPCSCGCDCCKLTDSEKVENDKPGPILNENQQQTVIESFQNVLRRISDFFDKFFDMIFEFLRFDEIMGR